MLYFNKYVRISLLERNTILFLYHVYRFRFIVVNIYIDTAKNSNRFFSFSSAVLVFRFGIKYAYIANNKHVQQAIKRSTRIVIANG